MARDNQISCISHLKLSFSPRPGILKTDKKVTRTSFGAGRSRKAGFHFFCQVWVWGSSLERFVICFAGFLRPLMDVLRGKEGNAERSGVLGRRSFLLFIICMKEWHLVCQFFLLIYNRRSRFKMHSRNNFSDPAINTQFRSDMLKSLRKSADSGFGPDS